MKGLKKPPLFVKILFGMVLGITLGLIAIWLNFDKFCTEWIVPLGTIFIRLLKLIAVPLVFISLIKGIGSLHNIRNLSTLGLKTLALYLATTIIAVVFGFIMVSSIKPGRFFPQDKSEELLSYYSENTNNINAVQTEMSPMQFIVDIVPENIFAAFGSNTNMLQVIFVAIIFGVAIVIIGKEKTKTVMKFVDEANDIILKIIDIIMSFAPIGVLALMLGLIIDFSGDVGLFASLGMYAFTVIISLFILILLFYPLLLKLFTKKKIKKFFKAMLPAQVLAFSTSSSAATLPVTMRQVEDELDISKETSSFVLPVGVTINMDGTSCYQIIAAVFLAQIMGLELSLTQIFVICITTVISSIGTPGIPGGSVVILMMVLNSVGIPAEGLALILGIDRPLDMLRTVVNVTGDATVACIVDNKKEKAAL
ncbi:dicarboxylate/amino acid:cation symporter [Odoribacter sp. OttesenSCG-928-L07]|nr:dicarboxylate/amino acid:cation symporter [Odoribacter sp. OttesenSCG-928-L07]MDL2239693.1 dicarboxylate/amino acid:cation symporter [Bacteroidales bacterium OttesenSCG-928-L14]MDL2240387.1 dicarboxylate/amino acid:cation symporter [Bacteroidales bacterium OttesenSCG-928-K22]